MVYKILDEELILRNVNAKGLSICKKLGLLQRGNRLTKEEQDLLIDTLKTLDRNKATECLTFLDRQPIVDEMDIYLNPEKLVQLVDAIFVIEEIQHYRDKWDEINTELVIQGAFDYMGKCQPSSMKSEDISKILVSLLRGMKMADSKS